MNNKRPTIGIVANYISGHGGMEHHLQELIPLLCQWYDVTIFSADRTRPITGVMWHRIPLPEAPNLIKLWLFYFRSRSVIRKHRPQVLLTTGAIVGESIDVAVVHFCHKEYRNKTKSILRTFVRKLYDWAYTSSCVLLESRVYNPRKTRQIVTVSSRLRWEIVTHYDYPIERITVIPNGVDLTRFQRQGITVDEHKQRLNLPSHSQLLLFVGGDWQRKGLPIIVQAMDTLLDKFPNCYLVVVGEGTLSAAIRPRVASHVFMVGKQTNVEDYFAVADIFVFPSHYEGFALVACEAAASKVPIVGTRVGGVEDLIQSDGGVLVEPTAAALTEGISRVLTDPKEAELLASHAFDRVQSLSWSNAAVGFRKVIDRVLNESGNSVAGQREGFDDRGVK